MHLRATVTDGSPLDHLIYTNQPGEPFHYEPDRFVLEARLPPVSTEVQIGVELPPGWYALQQDSDAPERCRWLIWPAGEPPTGLQAELVVTVHYQHRTIARGRLALPVWIRAYHTFLPEQHRLPWANTFEELGEVVPSFQHFSQTFRWSLFPRAFFRGLYRDAVGIRWQDDQVIGGLCTGIARLALARAIKAEPLPSGSLLDQVVVIHGRQLTDRALLAGVPWFFFPSPRRAYRRFLRDLLDRRLSDVCFDLNVPVPWRRDVLRALLGQGHTVVPYAVEQQTPDRAIIWVFDPNAPAHADETRVVIDLKRNRYVYPPLVSSNSRTTIVAVRLPPYLRGRTAFLASAGSLVLYGPRWPLAVALSVLTVMWLWQRRVAWRK